MRGKGPSGDAVGLVDESVVRDSFFVVSTKGLSHPSLVSFKDFTRHLLVNDDVRDPYNDYFLFILGVGS